MHICKLPTYTLVTHMMDIKFSVSSSKLFSWLSFAQVVLSRTVCKDLLGSILLNYVQQVYRDFLKQLICLVKFELKFELNFFIRVTKCSFEFEDLKITLNIIFPN